MKTIYFNCIAHCMWHSTMILEDIHYLPEGGYKYDRGTNPAQSDGRWGGGGWWNPTPTVECGYKIHFIRIL